MNLHLAEISTQVTPGTVAGLICDGAGWHQTGGELRIPDNIVLITLPPYAPEPNPMENVWDYLRANKLSAGVWDSYDEILDACANAWNWFIDDPGRIRSIGTREWATVMSRAVGIIPKAQVNYERFGRAASGAAWRPPARAGIDDPSACASA